MLRGKDAATRNAFALAGLRIAVGCLFLIFAQYKVFSTKFTLGGGFQSWINRFLQDGAAYPFMVPVLNDFVLPHLLPSHSLPHSENSRLELLYFRASASLLSGICVRLASAFGLVYMLTLLLSSNYPGAGAPLWEYFGAALNHLVLALCFLAFLVSHSDAVLSFRTFVSSRN